ncbi:MAG TPA: hypothetical protein PKY31_15870 [Spirochaetota bacterium]|nr:hypothetical protein [Spirochaetota bacterium]
MNRDSIPALFEAIARDISGDWVLVGGALLCVLGLTDRVTIDIDLVPLGKVTNRDQLAVMEIAEKNGFPPEAVNFGAEYFVKKQKGWEKELVLLRDTGKARIYRPTKRLFRRLKEGRATETDLADIALYESWKEDAR